MESYDISRTSDPIVTKLDHNKVHGQSPDKFVGQESTQETRTSIQ